jgi:PucR-like helix-turn-helix protein/diguanylate cyclase with GGDEF domain
MNAVPASQHDATPDTEVISPRLSALSEVSFDDRDAVKILRAAAAAVRTVSPCQVEASYCAIKGVFARFPSSQADDPDLEARVREVVSDGRFRMENRRWAWAFALRHRDVVKGCLIVSAGSEPRKNQMLLLKILAQQTGAALANAAMHDRDEDRATQLANVNSELETTNHQLVTTVGRLERQTIVHETLAAALAASTGEQGIVAALYELTQHPVVLEDRFGNLRAWAGPGQPDRYPKQAKRDREILLRELASQAGLARIGDRLLILLQLNAEILGVLALVDPDNRATEDSVFALRYASIVVALELSHQRNLAEIELGVRRDLIDDLLEGTDRDGAYARADALGHDLRRPHYVVVVQCAGQPERGLAAASCRAAAAMRLNYLQGRHAGLIVLLVDGRPDPRLLHHTISDILGRTASVIGIGSRCDVPSDFPQSFTEARRALNIRLRSGSPAGASAFDELGFYRLLDAAHGANAVEGFVREWLGALIDYDESKKSTLVLTLSHYLECGGSYAESAAALHIHRSTLRYRLDRIRHITGFDLGVVDNRFNLHAATRAWRFLNPIRKTED